MSEAGSSPSDDESLIVSELTEQKSLNKKEMETILISEAKKIHRDVNIRTTIYLVILTFLIAVIGFILSGLKEIYFQNPFWLIFTYLFFSIFFIIIILRFHNNKITLLYNDIIIGRVIINKKYFIEKVLSIKKYSQENDFIDYVIDINYEDLNLRSNNSIVDFKSMLRSKIRDLKGTTYDTPKDNKKIDLIDKIEELFLVLGNLEGVKTQFQEEFKNKLRNKNWKITYKKYFIIPIRPLLDLKEIKINIIKNNDFFDIFLQFIMIGSTGNNLFIQYNDIINDIKIFIKKGKWYEITKGNHDLFLDMPYQKLSLYQIYESEEFYI